jgi:uncharacterized protein YhaN
MRFERLYMNGFGIHRDRTITLDHSAPLTLFLGRNEAGKSTVMDFIRAMLFGFPTRANMALRHEPVHGGLYGGTLTIRNTQGEAVRVERYEKNGALKLIFEDGSEAGEAALHALLGGITADLYRNIFAFSISELQKLETLRSDEVSGFLFSSGMGVSGSAVLQAEKKFTAALEQLYKPRGTKQELNLALKAIDDGEAELRRSKELAGQFNSWQVDLQQLEERITREEQKIGALRGDYEWLNKCKQSRSLWMRLTELEQELSLLTDWHAVPEDAIVRLDQMLKEQERQHEQRELREIKRTQLRERCTQLKIDQALLSLRSDITNLIERSSSYQDNQVSVIELSKELESEQAEFMRQLRQIDASWTLEQLRRFPLSVAERDRIQVFADRLSALDAKRLVASAQREKQQSGRELLRQAAEEDIERLQEQEAIKLAGEAGRGARTQSRTAASRTPWMKHVIAASSLCIGLWMWLWLATDVSQALLVIAGISMGFGLTLFYIWGMLSESRKERAAALYQLEFQQADREIAAMRQQAERSKRDWLDWQRENAELSEREKRISEEFFTWTEEWTSYLTGYQLDQDLSPSTVLAMGQYAEQALQSAGRTAKTEARYNALQQRIGQYEQEVSMLLTQLGESPHGRSELLLSLKRAHERATAEQAKLEQLRKLQEEETAVAQEIEANTGTLQRTGQRLSELYQESAVESDTELRRAHSQFMRVSELMKEKRQTEISLFTWIKLEQAERLRDTLAELDSYQLEERMRSVDESISAVDVELNELKDKRGRLRGEMERVSAGTEHAGLLQQQQELVTSFEQSASKWMQLSLASALIRQAKEIYERERQPGVLRQASVYFSGMTGGRYKRVISRLGEKSIFVERESGELIESSYLSRGTAEQLYLAMRFALADEYAKTVALPIVMDDIFVNFDRERLHETISIMSEIAKHRQILLFTCHEHVAAAAAQALPSTQLIELQA